MTKDEAAKLIDETFKLAEESFSAGYEQARKDFRTIEDQLTANSEPIVRCKDCINRYSICPMITFHYSSGAISTITYRAQDDWWCCFGKRKEE